MTRPKSPVRPTCPPEMAILYHNGLLREPPSIPVATSWVSAVARPSEAGDAQLEVLVRYVGAEEWYTASGSPFAKPACGEDHRAA